jgi:hypothetical protein
MKIKVMVIDFETPRWLRKTIAYAVPMIGVLVAAGLAFAAPHQWNTNDPLKASDLNGLNVVANGTSRYSVGATRFVGMTATGGPNNNGTYTGAQVNGYTGSKALCAALGPSPSPTAHMCTGEEMVRSAALGIQPFPATVANGAAAWFSAGTIGPNSTNDCAGWNDGTTARSGPVWVQETGGGVVSTDTCDLSFPVLCCD